MIFFQKRLSEARKRIKLAVCERNILFWEQTPECFFHSLPFVKEHNAYCAGTAVARDGAPGARDADFLKVLILPDSFLRWLDVSELGNSTEIAQYLVTHARVSLNDGVNYGPGGAGHLRIVLGVYKDDQKVIDALERIRDALLAYPPQINSRFPLFNFPCVVLK